MYLMRCMKSLNPDLSRYGTKNECTRINTVLAQISEVSTGAVSLMSATEGWSFFFFMLKIADREGGQANAGKGRGD